MAAPSAPVIWSRQDGHVLYTRWKGVVGGATYTVYVAEGWDDAVAAATVLAASIDTNGWFFKVVGPYAGPVAVHVTATNAGSDESDASNVVRMNLRGAGAEPNGTAKPKG